MDYRIKITAVPKPDLTEAELEEFNQVMEEYKKVYHIKPVPNEPNVYYADVIDTQEAGYAVFFYKKLVRTIKQHFSILRLKDSLDGGELIAV